MYAANLPTAPAASACQLFTPVLPLATDALGHPSGTASRAGPGTARRGSVGKTHPGARGGQEAWSGGSARQEARAGEGTEEAEES